MNILNLLDKAIEMLDSSSKAVNLFKQLMDLSHKITRAEHPSSEEDVKQYYRVHDELVKEPKEAIARAYQVNTKIPPTTDTNIVAHYYDDAMQYIQKLGYNIDLLRKKATKEEMGKEDGRCWEGYSPVAGVKPYEKGSCEKDMSEVREVIAMLDKAINFYDPSQERDESGKWSGSGGGSGGGSEKTSGGVVSDEKTQEVKNKVYESIPEEVLDGSKEGSIFNEDALNRSSPLVPHIGGFRGGFPKDHPVREAFRQIARWTDDSNKEEPTKKNVKSSVEKLYNALVNASDYKDDKGVFDSVVSKIKSIKDSI
jgi:hypothetical protein